MEISNHCSWLLALVLGAGAAAAPAQAEHVDRWFSHRAPGAGATVPEKNLGNEVLYQLFVDRFANGNTANDCLDGGRFCDRQHQDWYRFWGGDLRGVIQQLPYLKGLGVTRLWLTPIFENQMVTVERQRYGRRAEVTAYHGYWIRDWFRLNPYFTDQGVEDFALVDELIAKAQPEMRLYLDTVANHTSPADATRWSLDYMQQREPLSRGSHRGALFRDGQYVTSFDEPGYFHRYGPIANYDDMYQVENYQLDGLADLDQDDVRVRDYLRDAHDFWLRRFPGLAGYRMDTIKHVPHEYWKLFDRDFYARHPNAEIVGEYFGAGPYNALSRKYYRETRHAMFDFDFRYAIQGALVDNQPMTVFSQLWSKDPDLGDARSLVTFVDNHDVARLRGQGMTEMRMRQAVGLMFMARGVPTVYYGLEQDLFHPNDPGDPYNRPMMARFDTGAPIYRQIAALSALRKANPSLRYGRTHVVHESTHILGFERDFEGHKAFFATSKNPITGRDRFEMRGLTFPDGTYRDVLTGKEYRITGGRLPVELANGDMIVLSAPAREAQQ